MNIYIVSIPMEEVHYDCYDSHVVVATNPKEARFICPHADEGAQVWKTSKVVKIGTTSKYKKPRVILSSFNAG